MAVNFGIKKKWILKNPTKGIEFFPVENRVKHVPSIQDISRILLVAEPDDQDYINTIKESLGRVNEINQLQWSDVNFKQRYIVLHARKKRLGVKA